MPLLPVCGLRQTCRSGTALKHIGVAFCAQRNRRDALRRAPRPPYAWDGVGDVRPFGAMEKNIVEGVY